MSRSNEERIRGLETTVERLLAVIRFLRSLFGMHANPEHVALLDEHMGPEAPEVRALFGHNEDPEPEHHAEPEPGSNQEG